MFIRQNVRFNLSVLNDVRILTIDNDRDTGALYTVLLKSNSATVITTGSIQEAVSVLNGFVPDLLVCEARFRGESIYPLIQQVRSIAQDKHRLIPIFVISTFPAINLIEQLQVKVEAYQRKPIDIDQFIAEAWSLILLSKITQLLTVPDWLARLDMGEIHCCRESVGYQAIAESRMTLG